MCLDVCLKSSASVVGIITWEALMRAGEAGFSRLVFLEKSISPASVTEVQQLLRGSDRTWASVPWQVL